MTGASSTSFYVDPTSSSWRAPNLVGDLIATPTTDHLQPLERQATIVLAWLVHHSRVFALALLDRFFAGDAQALDAAHSRLERIGSRAWGTLRPIEGVTKGSLYPDLSITGSARSFELLVEIKIGAAIHGWSLTDALTLHQPEAYLRSWLENYDEQGEAAVRRVGTLTLTGPGVDLSLGAHRASDLTWLDVEGILGILLESGRLEGEVVAVALDARAAIKSRILGKPAGALPEDPVLAWGYLFLSFLVPRLPDAQMKNKTRVIDDYVTAYTYHEGAGGPFRTWFCITPRGAKYNLAAREAMFWVGEPDTGWPEALKSALASHGFVAVKDIAGYKGYRFGIPVAEIQETSDEGGQVDAVLARLQPIIDELARA